MTASQTIALTYEDYLAATWLRTRQHWLRGGAVNLITRCAVLSVGLILISRLLQGGLTFAEALEIAAFGLLGSIAFFLFMMLLNLWYVPRACRRLFKELPSLTEPHEYTFSPEGLRSVGPFSSTNLPWSHMQGWVEDKRTLIICQNSILFFCLPKAKLGEDNLTVLKECLDTAGVKQGLKKTRP